MSCNFARWTLAEWCLVEEILMTVAHGDVPDVEPKEAQLLLNQMWVTEEAETTGLSLIRRTTQ